MIQAITFSTALKRSLEEKTEAVIESARIITVTAQLVKKEDIEDKVYLHLFDAY